ncbi:glycerate kinase type-2 family protein [Algicella marina]|uniref:DUF4147 domain-containing protein n=1 Tax=Algicella marina TaxID=2683284 RepID=A0A6P1T5V2_9RHOB|nr:glycerate kinase [Algicella marina]QHQ37135.1 DUF4147 domain-containing protein [Algicella marina]
MSIETDLRACFETAVAAALPSKMLATHLPEPAAGRTVVVGGGKGSAAMAAALEAGYGSDVLLEGIVVTRYGHAVPCSQIEIIEAAHPVPDATGASAARRILALAAELGPDDLLIALISGGGSALLSLMPPGVSEDDRAALNRALLASGAPIDEMNCIRRHVSRINGGRLAAAAHPARVLSLLISDVPGDDPMDIASGPTVGDPTTLADARELAARYDLPLTPALTAALSDPANESVKPDDPRLATATTTLIATPMQALEAAAETARARGWQVTIGSDTIEGEARETGRAFAREAIAARATMKPGDAPHVTLTGGETTVTLPRDDRTLGKGGRNVDFLLGFMTELGDTGGIYALAADTDGIDGAEEVAGAIVTPTSHARAGDRLAKALHAYDGHGLFAALGDQLITGPTLTNVNDFRAVLVLPPEG